MKLYSTNNPALRVPFEEAIFNSLPADKGLYMPVQIPRLDADFFTRLPEMGLQELAFEVTKALLADEIPEDDLERIVQDAVNFEAPLIQLADQTWVLELFHGPSLAFKDFGARFMSRIMGYFTKPGDRSLDIVVATSGDTGGAVASGFLGVPNTRVTILYPKGKVSPVQEQQLTTNGQNIRAIAIDGTFDDCQALAKQAFADADLNRGFRLTSANSINILRLIPQTFYYFHAYAILQRKGYDAVKFVVPSGNFGNIAAGILASRMGLPVTGFIAATNVNDTVPQFLETGEYITKPSKATLSNAMDVGAPSNWVRIMDMFDNDLEEVKKELTAYSFTDEQTLSGITSLFDRYKYNACPHTAVGWLAAKADQARYPGSKFQYVCLSTAHACKFPEVFPERIAAQLITPEQLQDKAKLNYYELPADFRSFKNWMLLKS